MYEQWIFAEILEKGIFRSEIITFIFSRYKQNYFGIDMRKKGRLASWQCLMGNLGN
jgi:hypothetical protein